MVFEESHLRFNFHDEEWDHLVKYDEEKDYRKLGNSIPGTKGVDFIGISREIIYFIEVKNYRGYRLESKPKIAELDIIVAQKVRDTLAGLLGGIRNSTHKKEIWSKHLAHVGDKKKQLNILLWMEEDNPNEGRQKVYKNILGKNLKRRMSWLSSRIIIVDKTSNPLEERLQVDFLPDL